MKQRIKTFWCEPAERAEEALRRFSHEKFQLPRGYHDAEVKLGQIDWPDNGLLGSRLDDVDHADPRWPTACACGYGFTDTDGWQHVIERCYRRTDTAELVASRDMPAGASYDAVWLKKSGFPYAGADGIAYTVVLPDGVHWHVDSRANNCTRPDDNVHKCWVREGDPRACNVTAGKAGDTCSAGAGSIATPNYHGFLRSGWLEEC